MNRRVVEKHSPAQVIAVTTCTVPCGRMRLGPTVVGFSGWRFALASAYVEPALPLSLPTPVMIR